MTMRMQATVALLVSVQGLVGCDGGVSQWAPTTASQATQQPSSNQEGYSLTASPGTVAPGGELSVSWTAPKGGNKDWIGLFSLGAPPCDHGWSEYTKGATSGTLTLTAPTRAGQYEFRYSLNDCDEAARSLPVTVGAGG